jgi:hypothetical protein
MNDEDQDDSTEILDYLFILLIFFIAMYLAALRWMNPIAESKRVDLKGDYVIQMDWDDESLSDFDLWVRDPAGNIVGYQNKSVGLMYLDIDDRGGTTDYIALPNGDTKAIKFNREIVTLRGTLKGEYTVNVHFYSRKDQLPQTTVKVALLRINPQYQLITQTEIVYRLEERLNGSEKTAFSFTLDDKGNPSGYNDLQRKFILRNQ